MRNFILYWLDTYATFTRFTTCGQGATPRCDAEVRRQGATPTCPRPRWLPHSQAWIRHRSSVHRRQIGGYIIAPRAHLTAKTEGRSGEREIVVYWYSFSNPRTVCIHYGFSLDTHTEILQGEHVLFGVVKCRCSEMSV